MNFYTNHLTHNLFSSKLNAERRTQNAERRTQNAERRTQNAERRYAKTYSFFSKFIFLFTLLIFTSCSLSTNYKTSSFNFTVPSSLYFRAERGNTKPYYKLVCSLSGAVSTEQTQYLAENETQAVFTFQDIPLKKNVYINLKVFQLSEIEGKTNLDPSWTLEKPVYVASMTTQLTDKENNQVTLALEDAPINYARWGWKVSGNELSSVITKASNNQQSTYLLLDYKRTKAGADEEIELLDIDFDINLTRGDTTSEIKFPYRNIMFDLDMYNSSAAFSGNNGTDVNGKLNDERYASNYVAKIPLNTQFFVGDIITIKLNNAIVTGRCLGDSATNLVDLSGITYAIVNDGDILDDFGNYVSHEWFILNEEDAYSKSIITCAEHEYWDTSKEEDNITTDPIQQDNNFYLPSYDFTIKEQVNSSATKKLYFYYEKLNSSENARIKIDQAKIQIKKNGTVIKILDNYNIEFTTNAYGPRSINLDLPDAQKQYPLYGRFIPDQDSRSQYKACIDVSDISINKGDTLSVEITQGELFRYNQEEIDLTNQQRNFYAVFIQESPTWKELSNIVNVSPGTNPNPPATGLSSQLVEIDSRTLQIGDLIFSDGKVLPYNANYTTQDFNGSDLDLSKAIAVIFKEGQGTDSALGVGLKEGSGLKWAVYDTTGYETKFNSLLCIPYYNGSESLGVWNDSKTWSGNTNGSTNWSSICSIDNNANSQKTNYPAFNFALTYSTTANINGTYSSNWFLPSVAELVELWKNKTIINNQLNNLSGYAQMIQDEYYWSSSQDSFADSFAIQFCFSDGDVNGTDKDYTEIFVRAIRAF